MWAREELATVTREVAARGRVPAQSTCGLRFGAVHRGLTMADLQQLRVQEAVDSMVKTLEKVNIRKMQVVRREPILRDRRPNILGRLPRLPTPSCSSQAMSCAAAPLPAEPDPGVPGVAAAPLKAGLALRQKLWNFD